MSAFTPNITSAFFPPGARHSTFCFTALAQCQASKCLCHKACSPVMKTVTTGTAEVFYLGSLGPTIQHSLFSAETEEPKRGFGAVTICVPMSETSQPQQFSRLPLFLWSKYRNSSSKWSFLLTGPKSHLQQEEVSLYDESDWHTWTFLNSWCTALALPTPAIFQLGKSWSISSIPAWGNPDWLLQHREPSPAEHTKRQSSTHLAHQTLQHRQSVEQQASQKMAFPSFLFHIGGFWQVVEHRGGLKIMKYYTLLTTNATYTPSWITMMIHQACHLTL